MDEEKKTVYEIITGSWAIIKKYGFTKMDDKAWEDLIKDADTLSDYYRLKGVRYWHLYRKIIASLVDYVEMIQKGDRL